MDISFEQISPSVSMVEVDMAPVPNLSEVRPGFKEPYRCLIQKRDKRILIFQLFRSLSFALLSCRRCWPPLSRFNTEIRASFGLSSLSKPA